MAKSTFSGPVVSNNGFIQAGSNNIVEITADTTLTFNDHAGRIIEVNDADGVITLPTIKSSEIGAKYTFLIQTAITGKIKTDGTDKYVGSIMVAVDDGAKNIKESINLISEMNKIGFKKIIATPHTYPGLYENTNESTISELNELKKSLVITTGDNYVGAAKKQLREKMSDLYSKVASSYDKPSANELENLALIENEMKSANKRYSKILKKVSSSLIPEKSFEDFINE